MQLPCSDVIAARGCALLRAGKGQVRPAHARRAAPAAGGGAGVLAAITLRRAPFALPPLWLPGRGIGQRHGQPLFFDIPLWACIGRAAMRLDKWAARMPHRLPARPLLSVAMNPFRATFLPPDAC